MTYVSEEDVESQHGVLKLRDSDRAVKSEKGKKKKETCQRELMKPGKQGRVMYWFGYNRPVFLLYPTAWFVAAVRKYHHHPTGW